LNFILKQPNRPTCEYDNCTRYQQMISRECHWHEDAKHYSASFRSNSCFTRIYSSRLQHEQHDIV